MPRLDVIIASTRPARAGASIGQSFTTVAREHAGIEVVLIDLAEPDLPMLDEPSPAAEGDPYLHEHTRRWSTVTSAADAFAFVVPEYNQGYTAPPKNALDYLRYEWHHKPMRLVSYGMTSGGLRAAQALKPVVSALKKMPRLESVVIHLRQAMLESAKGMLDELGLMTSASPTVRT